jgi:hypothetical protein
MPSAPMHVDVDGHEIDMFAPRGSTALIFHEFVSVGLVDVSMSPLVEAATHNASDGHEISVTPLGNPPGAGPESIGAYGVHCIVFAPSLGAASTQSATSTQINEQRVRHPRTPDCLPASVIELGNATLTSRMAHLYPPFPHAETRRLGVAGTLVLAAAISTISHAPRR